MNYYLRFIDNDNTHGVVKNFYLFNNIDEERKEDFQIEFNNLIPKIHAFYNYLDNINNKYNYLSQNYGYLLYNCIENKIEIRRRFFIIPKYNVKKISIEHHRRLFFIKNI